MNPNILAVFAALRSVLIALGAAMVAMNLGGTHVYSIVMQVSGSIMVVGPLLWAVFEKLVTLKTAIAAAVQAGINLTASGKAIDKSGNVISQFEVPGATPPKPVTVATAEAIVKDFAPPPATIAKA